MVLAEEQADDSLNTMKQTEELVERDFPLADLDALAEAKEIVHLHINSTSHTDLRARFRNASPRVQDLVRMEISDVLPLVEQYISTMREILATT